MTLLAVERIKLFTTRSPWWCALIGTALVVGFSALIAANWSGPVPMSLAASQFGSNFGLVVIMVMAALAVTTEYRFGTIRATFQAIPNRTAALLAKTTVVSVLALVIGEIAAFGALGIAKVIKPSPELALSTAADWRNVAGTGLIFGLAAVIAIAVGILVRHSAGAISIVLVYSQVIEPLVPVIPKIGTNIEKWLPFNNARQFLVGSPNLPQGTVDGPPPPNAALSPWWALAYFAAIAAVLLGTALVVANRRDA